MQTALSPDHPDFHKIFLEEEKELNKVNEEEVESDRPFYPANFVPANSKEKK